MFFQLFRQFFDNHVFVVVQEREVLDVHVCILQLFIKVDNFAFLVVHNEKFRVDILRWYVGDLRSSTSVVERAQILFEVLVRWG